MGFVMPSSEHMLVYNIYTVFNVVNDNNVLYLHFHAITHCDPQTCSTPSHPYKHSISQTLLLT